MVSDMGLLCLPMVHKKDAILISTATNPSPSSHIPFGLNFLFRNFESKIEKLDNAIR